MGLDVQSMLNDPLFQMGINTMGAQGTYGGFGSQVNKGVQGGIASLQQMEKLRVASDKRKAEQASADWSASHIPEGIDPNLVSAWRAGQITYDDMLTQSRLSAAAAAKAGGGGAASKPMSQTALYGSARADEHLGAMLGRQLEANDYNMPDEDKLAAIRRAKVMSEKEVNDPESPFFQKPLEAQTEALDFILSESKEDPNWLRMPLGGESRTIGPLPRTVGGPQQAPPGPQAPNGMPQAPGMPQQAPMAPQQGSMAPQQGSMPLGEAQQMAQDYMAPPAAQAPAAPVGEVQTMADINNALGTDFDTAPSPVKDGNIYEGLGNPLKSLMDFMISPAEGGDAEIDPGVYAATDIIKSYESDPKTGKFFPVAYKDYGGEDVWTVGYGETAGVKEGDTRTKEQAETEMYKRVNKHVKKIRKEFKGIPEKLVGPLASLLDNVGWSNFHKFKSSGKLTKAFQAAKAGDWETFMYETYDKTQGFVKSNGKVLGGLQKRRAAEWAASKEKGEKKGGLEEILALQNMGPQQGLAFPDKQYDRNDIF